RSGLVVTSRVRNWKTPGSKPDSSVGASGPKVPQIIRSGLAPSCWYGREVWKGNAESGVFLVI
ncbi:hypothetical protein AVEN_120382-1, partial [Araneus ventricosus]